MGVNVLIVDDQQSVRDVCVDIVQSLGLSAFVAESAARALSLLETGEIDIVLTDVRMPGLSGLELLEIIKQNYPDIEVVILTGYGTIPAAVKTIKLGAYDYLTKPFNVEDIRRVLQRLMEKMELASENRLLREQLKTYHGFENLVGTSSKMQKVYRMIVKVAAKRHPVFILGESGTGKELVARAIHAYGQAKDRPFVPVDCGALAPTLIESELFGHMRGAFTGAHQDRTGLLASARGGTVFLDEIAELSVDLQAKILRALQEREIKPIGSNQRTKLEARVIAATNRNLEEAVAQGTFRKDLYFRLNVVSIRIPPLRERKSDLPLLVQYFLDRHSRSEQGIHNISYEALTRMMNYDWPGNVRELENCIERAVALGTGPVIEMADLPSSVLSGSTHRVIKSVEVMTIRDMERRAIVQALQAAAGDRVQAAKMLGMGKTTIYRKLKEFGLQKSLPDLTSVPN